MRATTGLDNLGATCYLNATIQAIAHCPKLVHRIVNSRSDTQEQGQAQEQEQEKDHPTVDALRHLLIRMWGGGRVSIRPHDLLRSLAAPMAKQGIMEMRDVHDANELYMVISDILCESNPSIKRMMEGKTRGSTVCGKCGATSLTPLEPFVALNLDFKDNSNHFLEEMITRSFASEEIEGYQCDADSCKSHSNSHRTLELCELPTALTFVLKRFLLDGNVNRAEVTIPGTITIRGPHSASYNLCSVICHSGQSQAGGHYVTVARHPGSGEWSIHDDDGTIGLSDSINCHGSFIRRCAYMIFYERQNA